MRLSTLLPQEQVVRRLTTDRTAPDNQVPLVYDPSAIRCARPLRDVGPAQSGRPDRRLVRLQTALRRSTVSTP
ncbi:MAG: hypothetical protein R3A10_15045 [Caldilineaceae bacterium]